MSPSRLQGSSSLHVAAAAGSLSVVKSLLWAGADPLYVDLCGETALHALARCAPCGPASALVARVLVAAAGADLVGRENDWGEDALFVALAHGRMDVVNVLAAEAGLHWERNAPAGGCDEEEDSNSRDGDRDDNLDGGRDSYGDGDGSEDRQGCGESEGTGDGFGAGDGPWRRSGCGEVKRIAAPVGWDLLPAPLCSRERGFAASLAFV
jgi:Ankyrin repeats (3 copies)